mmetsp:Transcript_32313/g.64452  ORF Transcript_32313/g.64452 Transcript_32313/m.64452 type:complete len:277 (-) Transcript_32313:243-1073(-)
MAEPITAQRSKQRYMQRHRFVTRRTVPCAAKQPSSQQTLEADEAHSAPSNRHPLSRSINQSHHQVGKRVGWWLHAAWGNRHSGRHARGRCIKAIEAGKLIGRSRECRCPYRRGRRKPSWHSWWPRRWCSGTCKPSKPAEKVDWCGRRRRGRGHGRRRCAEVGQAAEQIDWCGATRSGAHADRSLWSKTAQQVWRRGRSLCGGGASSRRSGAHPAGRKAAERSPPASLCWSRSHLGLRHGFAATSLVFFVPQVLHVDDRACDFLLERTLLRDLGVRI